MLTADYIVGLVDGEGSFTVYVRNPKDFSPRKRRVKVEPRFYIKLVEKDQKILYALKKFFSCGNVYFQKDARANHQQCYRYEVANRTHLKEIIIPFFRKHTLRFPSKQKDFKIFCSLMDMMRTGKHLTEKGQAKIYLAKQKMH
ncbi:LAGLIDADG family homing endonuclease [Candidatus Azambacteria bacterium]|nr:LAGLIDADG family homing endonuclease [Candidatus Azambacteria bacterium]